MPRAVWVCGSKKISTCRTLSSRCPIEVGRRQVVKILLGLQNLRTRVVNVQKGLQVLEVVRLPHLIDIVVRQLNRVPLR